MGGGKGSKQTTTVKLPEELEQGAVGALGGAMQSASLGYRPNQGITIAGFSPQQEAAMRSADAAASAFGLGVGGGGYLPQQETGAGGVKGYSTGALLAENIGKSMTQEDVQQRDEVLANYGMIGNKILGGPRLGDLPLNRVSPYGTRAPGGK